jgi:hypothetical protein
MVMADTREILLRYMAIHRECQVSAKTMADSLENEAKTVDNLLLPLIASRETEARLDEVEKIPVIETTGVGYEVIVSHRLERRRQLYNERDRIAALTAQEKPL